MWLVFLLLLHCGSSHTKKEKKQNEIESEALQKLNKYMCTKANRMIWIKVEILYKISTARSVQIRMTERMALHKIVCICSNSNSFCKRCFYDDCQCKSCLCAWIMLFLSLFFFKTSIIRMSKTIVWLQLSGKICLAKCLDSKCNILCWCNTNKNLNLQFYS